MTVSLSVPAAIGLAIALTGFMALYGLIGYTAWRAMRDRQRRNQDRR